MNLNLLPHAKNIINELMEQTIIVGYSCGESIMHYVKKSLTKEKQKLYATILLSHKGTSIILYIRTKNLFSVKVR